MAQVKIFEVRIKGIDSSVKSVGSLNDAIKQVKKEIAETDFGTSKHQELQKTMAQLKGVQGLVKDEQKLLNSEFKNAQSALNPEAFARYNKRLAAVKLEQKQTRQSTRQLTNELEAQKVDPTSLRGLELQYTKLRGQIKLLSREQRKAGAGRDLVKQAAATRGEIVRLNAEMNDFRANVGNYSSGLGQLGGVLQSFGGSFGIGGASAILAGGTAAFAEVGIEAIVGVAQAVRETIAEFNALKTEISTLTGETGNALDTTTARIKTIADVFNKDYTEVLRAANAESKQTGISLSQSLDAIENRFLAGADASGELLDSMKEYAPFINEAKLSTEQFSNILAISAKQGVFSDKGIDAVKEGVIRLRELPKATEDAVNALGITSAELENIISEKGIGGAIAEVSKRIGRLKDDSPVAGKAIADIFGGAGEDAGVKYIKSLKDINSETGSLIDTSNAYVVAQLSQLEAVGRLNEAQAKLSSVFGEGNVELSVFSTTIKAEAVEALVEFLNATKSVAKDIRDILVSLGLMNEEVSASSLVFDILEASIRPVFDGIKVLSVGIKTVNAFFTEAHFLILETAKAIGRLDFGSVLENFTGFFDGVAERAGYANDAVTGSVSGIGRQLAEQAKKAAEAAKNNAESTKKRTEETDKYSRSLDGLKARQEEVTKAIKAAVAAGDENRVSELRAEYLKLQTEVDKYSKALDFSKTKTEKQAESNQAAIGSIANLRGIISELKKDIEQSADPVIIESLNNKLIEAEAKLDAAEEKLDNIRKAAAGIGGSQEIEIGAIAPQDLELLPEQDLDIPIVAEIDKPSFDAAAEFLKSEREREAAEWAEQARQNILQAGSIVQEVSSFASEFIEAGLQNRLDSLETERQAELEAAEGNQAAQEEINKKYDNKRAVEEKKAANKRKAIAQIENVIATALAITKALPNIPLSILAGATGLANAALISKQKFQRGGILEGASHAQGGVPVKVGSRVVEAEGGEVIINKKSSRRFRKELAAINSFKGWGKKFAEGGVVGSTPPFASIGRTSFQSQGVNVNLNPSLSLSNEDIERITQGVAAGTYEGAKEGAKTGTKDGSLEGAKEVAEQQETENLNAR